MAALQPDLPFVRSSPTSELAAKQAEPASHTQRRRVLDLLRGSIGLTDEQMQDVLKMNPSTQRPRRIELVKAGLVVDSGLTAKTSSGRLATIWRAR